MPNTLKKTGLLVFLSIGCFSGFTQSTNATLNEAYYQWVTRYGIKAGRFAPEHFTSVRLFKRKAMCCWAEILNGMR